MNLPKKLFFAATTVQDIASILSELNVKIKTRRDSPISNRPSTD